MIEHPRIGEGAEFALVENMVCSMHPHVMTEDRKPHGKFILSLTPFRRIVKDYFFVCDSYYQAIRSQPPSRIQAIDMGRRALHDEGSRLLTQRLDGKIELDHDTARRLFTLICALHWRG